jgi:uncharacterized protein YdaU (DUF1376 family)
VNFYPHHIGDYISATAHLSWAEDCAYRRLLDAYYTREAPLPADVAACCRLVRAASKDERAAVGAVLREFFQPGPNGWSHRRCDAEIERASSKRTKAAESAKKRWQSERYANALPTDMRTHCEGNAPNPNPNPREETHTPREASESAAVTLAKAFRKAGVDANSANPEVRALAEQGVTPETVTAACEEARSRKPGERLPVAYVARMLETWAKRAKETKANGAHAPPANARPLTAAQAAAATLGALPPRIQPDFEVIDVPAPEPSFRAIGR